MRYRLCLFVSGDTVLAERSENNLRRLCDRYLTGCYDLEVVDVLREPQRAEDERILVTPTLVRSSPAPERKVIGDLSQSEGLLAALDVQSNERDD